MIRLLKVCEIEEYIRGICVANNWITALGKGWDDAGDEK
jgi:hypothetical protein